MKSPAQQIWESFFNADLVGHRLILKPYSETRDLENIADLLANPLVTGPMGIPSSLFTIEKLRESKLSRSLAIENGDWTIFITESSEPQFAGEIGIPVWDVENYIVDIFIAIHPENYGKGFGMEAMT